MKNNKKIVLVALLLTFALAVALLTACAPKVTLVAIELEQTTYVLGQELKGTVAVDVKGEAQQWELDREGLIISGYKPNTLGKQTVTVAYDDQTLETTVTVVPRVEANEIKTDYTVGDAFDTAGTLTFTRDNGTRFQVALDNTNLVIEGFSTQAEALPLTVSVSYTEGERTYSGEFSVYVYGITSMSLKKPVDTVYESHESALDLNGCYLTLETEVGTSYVQVTTDMCKGFDLSVVSQQNPTATQTITVEYAGKTKTFQITITYSDVSFIRDSVATLAEIDWTGETTPTLSAEEGALATLVAEKYFALNDAQKAMISPEDLLVVMKNAAVYVYGLYLEEGQKYDGAFQLTTQGVGLQMETYEAVDKANKALSDENTTFRVYGRLLEQIKNEFGASVFFGEVNFKTYLAAVYPDESMADVLEYFDYLIALHDGLTVPDQAWQASDLEAYANQIELVTLKINASKFRGSNFRVLYEKLSSWRANDDYFDILYTYYFNKQNYSVLLTLPEVYLPGEMEDLYSWLSAAYMEAVYMANGEAIDSSLFMLYYDKGYDIAMAVTRGDNEMYKFVYANAQLTGFFFDANGNDYPINFAGLMYYLTYTDIIQFGWLKHQGMMRGNAQFDAMWDAYLTVLNGSLSADYMTGSQFGVDIKAMFEEFSTLAPNTQYEFLRSINAYYTNGTPTYALDTTQYCYSYFPYFLLEYYSTVATEAEMELFEELLLAMEYYALANHRENVMDLFTTSMQKVVDGYAVLSQTQKDNFTALFGTAYTRYEHLLKVAKGEVEQNKDFGDYTQYFTAITNAIYQMVNLENDIKSGAIEASNSVIKMLSAYEYAENMLNAILESAPQEVVYAYYNAAVIPVSDSQNVTIEFMMYYCRSLYMSLLNNVQIAKNTPLASLYFDSKLKDFLVRAYQIVWLDLENTVITNDLVNYIVATVNQFKTLPLDDKVMLVTLDPSNDYYGNFEKLCQKVLNTAVFPIAQKLINIEQMYLGYQAGNTEITIQNLTNAMAEITEMKNALQGTDVGNFDSMLKEMYNYYFTVIGKLQEA